MTEQNNARFALLLLTALNFFNYVDRNVLFAVQPLIQHEFKIDDAKMGFLTTAFFICYMVAAPLIAPLADRYPRKWIMAAGAVVWSLATLLSAVTHSYDELLLRHLIVGIGEATFVVISPAFLADLFPERIRGRVMGLFYLSLPVGSAVGYVMGGVLGHHYGWRTPFLVGAIPGLLLAAGMFLIKEPKRGASDQLPDSKERGTILGLFRNKGYWTVSLGMAMMTFAVGGMQVWMPTFLTRVRGVPLDKANLVFGGMTVVAGTVATLFGGWLGDRLLRRTPAAYLMVSAAGMLLSIPAVVGAIYLTGSFMYGAILIAEFFILLNTAPLNAALVNSVSAPIRATAVAVNLFTIHLLGDAFSPTLIGYISDRTNLQMGMVAMIVAVALSGVILVYGMKYAPHLPPEGHDGRGSFGLMWPGFGEHPMVGCLGIFLGLVWMSRLFAAAIGMRKVADIALPEYDVAAVDASGGVPRVSIVVPARNEGEHIEAALRSLLDLDYSDYDVIAVDDRSEDETGPILDRLAEEWRARGEASHHLLKVIHVKELPAGWLGKTHAMWLAGKQATGDWLLFTDADVVFRQDALRRAVAYAEGERADHLVLFPTMVMKSAGERMMMAFFQSQFVFGHRPWKVADPKSKDAIGVGAFNLIRRSVYEDIGTYQRLRMAVLDDMRLGEVVKQEGFRQRLVFGRNLLKLRWVFGTLGMVRNLTKNFFAILHFNAWFAAASVMGILVVNLLPFVGIWMATAWGRVGFEAALVSLALIYVGMSWWSEISPLYVVLHPVGTVMFCYAIVRSVVLTVARRGIVWRGTWYSLAELRRFGREEKRWTWL